MEDERINFFTENIDFSIKSPLKIRNWIAQLAEIESYTLECLNFIFCTDDYLLDINKEFLRHDYYTDIITFNNSEADDILIGDIFISIDRAVCNANELNIDCITEVYRLIAHGVLHLVGYNDKTKEEKAVMTERENYYLSLLP